MNDLRSNDNVFRSEEENRLHSDSVEREGIFGNNDATDMTGRDEKIERKMDKAEKKMDKAHEAKMDAEEERLKGNFNSAERKEDKAERKIDKAEKKIDKAWDTAKQAGRDIKNDLEGRDTFHDYDQPGATQH